jgi:hypothetical protein
MPRRADFLVELRGFEPLISVVLCRGSKGRSHAKNAVRDHVRAFSQKPEARLVVAGRSRRH